MTENDYLKFAKSYPYDVLRAYNNGILQYRSLSDVDEMKERAKNIIKAKALKLEVFSDSSLAQMKMFQIRQIN